MYVCLCVAAQADTDAAAAAATASSHTQCSALSVRAPGRSRHQTHPATTPAGDDAHDDDHNGDDDEDKDDDDCLVLEGPNAKSPRQEWAACTPGLWPKSKGDLEKGNCSHTSRVQQGWVAE